MTKKTLAHFTDPHLGQKLLGGGDVAGEKMAYANRPSEHVDRLRIVLDDIERRGISDVVFGGDIGEPGSVPAFFHVLDQYGFDLSVVLGNHDSYRVVAPYCRGREGAIEGKMCVSEIGAAGKFIRLDSSDNRLGAAQIGWLRRELEDARRVVLFLHHPVLDIGTPVEHAGLALQDRHEVRRLLTSSHCEISIFCGHFHMVDEAVEANIRQFVSPAVSYQIDKNADRIRTDASTFGYRIIEFGDDGMDTHVVSFEEPG